jgi:hypothetical protein
MSEVPKKLFNFNYKSKYITVTELAKYFAIEPRQLNQILTKMNWIRKEFYIWWVATDEGKENGAIEYTAPLSRVRYVYWEKSIMQNQKLINKIRESVNTYIENDAYEEFIKEYFKQQNYTVWHHSKEKKEEDKNKNITFIAKKAKQILLIHCRDNQLDISTEELKSFQEQRDQFKIDNPVFEDYELSLHYTMSGFFLTEDAYEYVEGNKGDITYEIIKGESESTWLDSLLLSEKKS